MAEEKNFENRIKDFLKEKNCWFIKYWSGTSTKGKKFTKDGIPDILVCCHGKFMGVEVKAPHGKPKVLQLYHLRKIEEAGGFAILLYPDQWEVFKNFIDCVMANDPNMFFNYDILKRTRTEWEKKLKEGGDVDDCIT